MTLFKDIFIQSDKSQTFIKLGQKNNTDFHQFANSAFSCELINMQLSA